MEKRKAPTLHVVCSLIPEIHFTVGPTRNAISAILNDGHRIIVQAFLSIPNNEDVEGLSDHKLACPSLLDHIFHPPQVSSLGHKAAQGKTKKSKHNVVMSRFPRGSAASGRFLMLLARESFSNWRPVRAERGGCTARGGCPATLPVAPCSTLPRSPLPNSPRRQHLPTVEPVRHI